MLSVLCAKLYREAIPRTVRIQYRTRYRECTVLRIYVVCTLPLARWQVWRKLCSVFALFGQGRKSCNVTNYGDCNASVRVHGIAEQKPKPRTFQRLTLLGFGV